MAAEAGSLSDAFCLLRAAAERVVDLRGSEGAGAQAEGWQAILDLKARNRELYLSLEARRVQTAEAKAALEKTHLQLQNLLYEKAHYTQEIKSCREFKSAYSEEEVGLSSEVEFAAASPALASTSDGHARMLSRLSCELAERKRLAEDLLELKRRRKALLSEITGQRTLVLSLSSELAEVRKATTKLAAMVGSPVQDGSLAASLPPALSNLYASFTGCGHPRRFQVSVLGKAEAMKDAAAAVEAEEDGEDERAARTRDAAEAAPALGEQLGVLLDLIDGGGRRVLGLRFELAAAGGGVHVRVVEGESSVLQQGDGAEEEGQADAAAPRWAQQLCDAVDGGIAASVLTSLWGYVEARRSIAD